MHGLFVLHPGCPLCESCPSVFVLNCFKFTMIHLLLFIRTNTVILIDAEGNVTFTERTMLNCDTSNWRTSSFKFKLEE